MKISVSNPRVAAVTGLLFCLPFLVLNAIVATQMPPLFSMIRPGPHTSRQEYFLLPLVLLLMPIGAFVAIRPLLQKDDLGKRKLHIFNIVVAAILLGVFAILVYVLGEEIYRCDILGIKSCD